MSKYNLDNRTCQPTIVALAGRMCSGKDTIGGIIQKELGFTHVSTSDVVRRYIVANRLGKPTRDLTRTVACQLRDMGGADYLIKRAMSQAEPGMGGGIVLSGIYSLNEAIAFKALGGNLIGVHADSSVRRQRVISRSRAGEDGGNFDELTLSDDGQNETDQNLAGVLGLVDYEMSGELKLDNIADEVRLILKSVQRRQK